MERVTPNMLALGIVRNEINYFMIMQSLSSQTTNHFVAIFYGNRIRYQNQTTMVKQKPLRLLPENISCFEYAKRKLGTYAIVTLANEAGPCGHPL
jgi:hypothetical protein